jgi:hypothetical protein
MINVCSCVQQPYQNLAVPACRCPHHGRPLAVITGIDPDILIQQVFDPPKVSLFGSDD